MRTRDATSGPSLRPPDSLVATPRLSLGHPVPSPPPLVTFPSRHYAFGSVPSGHETSGRMTRGEMNGGNDRSRRTVMGRDGHSHRPAVHSLLCLSFRLVSARTGSRRSPPLLTSAGGLGSSARFTPLTGLRRVKVEECGREEEPTRDTDGPFRSLRSREPGPHSSLYPSHSVPFRRSSFTSLRETGKSRVDERRMSGRHEANTRRTVKERRKERRDTTYEGPVPLLFPTLTSASRSLLVVSPLRPGGPP